MDHPIPGSKFLELDPSKRLGKKVGNLVLSVDVVSLYAPILKAALDEVVLYSDVLASLLEDMILCWSQRRLSVHPHVHCFSISTKKIAEKPRELERMIRSETGADLLGLTAGQGHHLLLDGMPTEEATAEEEEHPTHAPASVDVASVVPVFVVDEACHVGIPQEVVVVV
jgi:hypothetical protein